MTQPPPMPKNRHSLRPLLFAPPQGSDALPPTLRPPPPPPSARLTRSANDSHVRLRAQAIPLPRSAELQHVDAHDVLDELCEDQLAMSADLAQLEESVAGVTRDASAQVARRTLEARVADLRALRDRLAGVHLATADARLLRLFVPESPLADYLRGVYAWAHAVVGALDHLVESLCPQGDTRARPDWARFRGSIEEAKNLHFDELHEPIRADILALTILAQGGSFGADHPPIEELHYAVEHLISTALAVETHLDKRFG